MKTDLELLNEAEEKNEQLTKELEAAKAMLAEAKITPVERLSKVLNNPSPPKTLANDPTPTPSAPGAPKTAAEFDAELKAITNPHEAAAYWAANAEAIKHAHRVDQWEKSQERRRNDPSNHFIS